ncbi:PAQR family membrane homeostasis protein TrhA [Jonesia quinghaiensis]|uniref:PAQR family membrane homeostasis protein TrhA n=1 Tax=Jonesia quinghaiensis TaxID=262806 RepID=UPI0003F88F09|nr:hemolysin III family protein [Jonesia quinghaiensis]
MANSPGEADNQPRDGEAHPTSEAAHNASTVAEKTADQLGNALTAIKPKLRGWIHAGTFPLSVIAGIILIVLAPATAPKVACIVFAISSWLLFGTSAVYHRGTWSPPVFAALRRWDHSNIFLIIAGTYTPLAVTMLPTRTATILLVTVWTGALLGLAARIIWLGAPRWVYVPIYIALGWVALWFLPQFWTAGGPAVVWLIAGGGFAYTVGAVMYALKRPNPSPLWFGFHEIFHICTVIGFFCHYAAVMIAILALR